MSGRVYEVEIRVGIQEKYEGGGYTNNRFDTSETVRLQLSGFTEIAAVLGQFHQLAEKMQNGDPT